MSKRSIPDKPYEMARVLSTKVSPEFHRQLREVAAEKDASVSAVIKTALQQYLAAHTH